MIIRKQFGILIALALGAMILSSNRKISLFSMMLGGGVRPERLNEVGVGSGLKD